MADNPLVPGSASDEAAPTAAPIGVPEAQTPPGVEASPRPTAMNAPALEPAPPLASGPPPAPAARKRGRRWIAVTLIVIFVLAGAGGAGAYLANVSLSKTYSPQQALLNYFAAQGRGDVATMMSDATYLRGDGSYEQFFDKDGLTAMMKLDQNRAVGDVKIISSRVIDSSTVDVTASMMWGGSLHTDAYVVRENPADTHYVYYHSWKVEVPYTTMNLSLPNQPGTITLDGMLLPSGSTTSVEAIAGYHRVEMLKTPFYDDVSKVAEGIDVSPNIAFDGTIGASALAAAAAAVRSGSTVCDATQYTDCPGHVYHAPVKAYTTYYLTMPGYPEIDFNSYVFNYSGDIASGMTLTVSKDEGLAYASGVCRVTLTVDGKRTYAFTGTWSADVTSTDGVFKADVYPDCAKAKA